jgi:hypothetical protein
MVEVKLTSDKGSMEKRVSDRLKSSGEGASPDWQVQKGTGLTDNPFSLFSPLLY